MTNITILSVVWGDWFERFGHGWIESLEAAGAERAVLVSDRKVDVPKFVNLIVADFENHAQFCNLANNRVETEWALWLGFDDLLVEGALNPIDSQADIYGFPALMGGLRLGVAKYLGDYENTWRLSHNPMAGAFAYRKELLAEIPFRDYIYLDWIHFCETSFFKKAAEFSDVPRVMWVRRDESLSLTGNVVAHSQVHDFQNKLSSGFVLKGIPE